MNRQERARILEALLKLELAPSTGDWLYVGEAAGILRDLLYPKEQAR